MNTISKKKTIMIVGTGGTIAGKGKKGETAAYDSAQIQVDDLVAEIPELEQLANLKSTELFSVDSCDMSFDNLIRLSKYINEQSNDENIDGFVMSITMNTMALLLLMAQIHLKKLHISLTSHLKQVNLLSSPVQCAQVPP